MDAHSENECIDEMELKRRLVTQSTDVVPPLSLSQKISQYVRECYVQERGNIRQTARALDVSPNTVYRYLSLLDAAPERATLKK